MTVVDTNGNQATASVDVLPRTSTLTFATVPAGLQLSVDGQNLYAPTSFASVVGMSRSLSTPSPQSLSGSNYNFVVWSDGGAQTHSVTVPTNGAGFTASFVQPTLLLTNGAGTLTMQWPAWAAPFSVWSATNLAPPVAWVQITGTFVTNSGNVLLNLPATNGAAFYRLQYP
jgi:hypothetical protein